MKKSKIVLLADDMESDDSKSKKRSQAVRGAATILAKKLDSSIELVHVEDLTLYPVSKPYYREYIQNYVSQKRYQLKKAAHALKGPVHVSLVEGYPAEALIQLTSKKNKYEFLALGTHGRRGMKRVILGSVAEEVIRNSRIPVLVLGPQAQTLNRNFFSENSPRILVATDLSENGKTAESYALYLAQRLSAEVILFHSSHSEFQTFIGPAFTSGKAWRDYLKPQIIEEMEKRVTLFKKQGIQCSSCMAETELHPSSAILKQVKRLKPSLVIMGTHGRNLFSGAFLGSTSREMILNSPIPVMIIRSR